MSACSRWPDEVSSDICVHPSPKAYYSPTYTRTHVQCRRPPTAHKRWWNPTLVGRATAARILPKPSVRLTPSRATAAATAMGLERLAQAASAPLAAPPAALGGSLRRRSPAAAGQAGCSLAQSDPTARPPPAARCGRRHRRSCRPQLASHNKRDRRVRRQLLRRLLQLDLEPVLRWPSETFISGFLGLSRLGAEGSQSRPSSTCRLPFGQPLSSVWKGFRARQTRRHHRRKKTSDTSRAGARPSRRPSQKRFRSPSCTTVASSLILTLKIGTAPVVPEPPMRLTAEALMVSN